MIVETGAQIVNSVVRGPTIIGENTRIVNSYIGPFTSIYHDCVVENAESSTAWFWSTAITDVSSRITDSLIGRNVEYVVPNSSPAPSNSPWAINSRLGLSDRSDRPTFSLPASLPALAAQIAQPEQSWPCESTVQTFSAALCSRLSRARSHRPERRLNRLADAIALLAERLDRLPDAYLTGGNSNQALISICGPPRKPPCCASNGWARPRCHHPRRLALSGLS